MNAVVALPDEEHTARIAALWDELERDFGVREARSHVPWPHLSLQGADEYAVAEVDARLRVLTAEATPITVAADGLGIFAGPQPVLYVPVQRTEALNRIHGELWRRLAPFSRGMSPYYAPERWAAHVTLAQWDIPPERLGAVISRLAARPLAWEMRLVALGLIVGVGDGIGATYRLHARYPLGG